MNKAMGKLYRFCFFFIFFFFPTVLFAQEAEGAGLHHQDVVLVWAKRMGLFMTIVAAALILVTLLFYRNRLMEPRAKWLLFVGLCAFPLPVIFLSNGVGLEESKEVAFCESCHVMDPFLNDMRDRESESLTARHYRNRYIQREHCWTCHSDYGVFGTAEAKMTGLIHFYKYTTATYELPIHLYSPYNFGICLNCHAQSALYQEELSHEGVIEAMEAGEITCTDCHGLAHPEPEERSSE